METPQCAREQARLEIFLRIRVCFPGVFLAFEQGQEADEFIKKQWFPFLELTHNHGTETDASFKYSNGNDPPQGYGHIGMLCDNLEEACAELEAAGVKFRKRPQVRACHREN